MRPTGGGACGCSASNAHPTGEPRFEGERPGGGRARRPGSLPRIPLHPGAWPAETPGMLRRALLPLTLAFALLTLTFALLTLTFALLTLALLALLTFALLAFT